MKTIHFIYLFSLILLLGCSEDLIDGNEKGTLYGTVRLELTHEPLVNVKITTTPSTLTVYSDEDGNFEILEAIPMGDYSVMAELNGYVTEVKAFSITQYDQTVSIDFEMITDETLNRPPSTPELISPENLSVDQPNDLVLQWSSTDPDGDSLTYRVLLSDNLSNNQIEFEDLVYDTLALNNLHFGATYTWQVVASDGINDEVFSSSSQFTVRQNPEYRYHFVQIENGNYIIRSTNLDETINITNSAYSSWRPHKNNVANKIAFLQTIAGQTHLMTADLNGENKQQISQVPLNGFRSNYLDFAWHKDGSKFIFPSFDVLYMVNSDGTGQHQIYQTPDGHFITKCAWSYDGSKIAIVTNDIYGYQAKIHILSSTGAHIETIFENQNGAVGGLDWNITGDKLLFTHDVSGYQDNEYRQLDTRILIYNFSDSSIEDFSQLSEKPTGTIDIDPTFTPDDSGIIFTNTSNDLLSTHSIYMIKFDEPESRELILFDAQMPDYK